MEELIGDDRKKMVFFVTIKTKHPLESERSYDRSYSFSDALVHDKHPDTTLAYKAEVKNPLGSDDVSLSAALQNADELPSWKEATRDELTSLIEKWHVF